MCRWNSTAGVNDLDANISLILRLTPVGFDSPAAIGFHRIKRIRHKRDEDLLHLAFVYANRREGRIQLLYDAHLAQLWMMFDELQGLLDDLIDIDGEFLRLALMREFQKAVCDCLAPECFVANYLEVLG